MSDDPVVRAMWGAGVRSGADDMWGRWAIYDSAAPEDMSREQSHLLSGLLLLAHELRELREPLRAIRDSLDTIEPGTGLNDAVSGVTEAVSSVGRLLGQIGTDVMNHLERP
jgi:hypothetical protein